MISWRAIRPCCILYLFLGYSPTAAGQYKTGELVIHFLHTAGGKELLLRDSMYVNPFQESYKVSRLKYYISNIKFAGLSVDPPGKNIFLIEAGAEDSILLQVPVGTFNKLYFTLGVDSVFNCSGAQDGALDPLNGMFWTWNSGYIFFKLEGVSPSSPADLNRIEHHIGGYTGPNKAGRVIELNLGKTIEVKEKGAHRINIQLDLDSYWRSVNDIKIGRYPLVMAPGELAKRSADNFAAMFSVISFQ